MSSKISNKPDNVLTSPLKPTSFPLDMSLFQVSQASSNNKKSSPPTQMTSLHYSSSKVSEAQPNLFQYNDRSPLLFSSDEEDYAEPHFNYYADGRDVKLVGMTVSPFALNAIDKNDKKVEIKDKQPVQKPTVKDENHQLTIHELLKQQKPIKNISPSQDSKMEQLNIAKVYSVGKQSSISNKKQSKIQIIPPIIQQPKKEQEFDQKIQQTMKVEPPPPEEKMSHLGYSKSETIFQKQKLPLPVQKQSSMNSSSKFSKTDEIIYQVNPHKKQDILIQQQSDISSEKHYEPKPTLPKQQQSPITVRDSMQSIQGNPQKKRRNRIFDNSSVRNKQKQNTVTPQKGVQTQDDLNRSFNRQQVARQYDFYPQIKALNVLNKLVDQINPNISRNVRRSAELDPSFLQFVVSCNDELQSTIRMFNNVTIIDKLQDQRLLQARKQMTQKTREVKLKLSRYMNIRVDEDLIQSEQKIIRYFEELSRQFEIIDEVIQNFIDTKYRLALLMQNSKGFMISLKKGQLKKVYCILREMAVQIESLKQLRAACGNFRLERMFKQFLEGQIRLLTELEQQMRQKVENVAPTIKI